MQTLTKSTRKPPTRASSRTRRPSASYTVLVAHDPKIDRYAIEIPELPGCISAGDTIDEAFDNIRDAARLYLATVPNHQRTPHTTITGAITV